MQEWAGEASQSQTITLLLSSAISSSELTSVLCFDTVSSSAFLVQSPMTSTEVMEAKGWGVGGVGVGLEVGMGMGATQIFAPSFLLED